MKKKICYYVHTEYHLLTSIIDIDKKYSDSNIYDVHIVIKRTINGKRLNQELNLDILPYTFHILDITYNLKGKLEQKDKEKIDELLQIKFDTFIFFQEQDHITIILVNQYTEYKTNIYLYPDGLKAYCFNSMAFMLAMHINNFQQNKWIARNGYRVTDRLSFLKCNKYGYLKGITKLFILFPDSYINETKLPVEQLDLSMTLENKELLKKVFNWDDSLLPQKEKVFFFMNQPISTGHDGTFETHVLKRLTELYPEHKFYIKLHPLTKEDKYNLYKTLKNVEFIESKIPAEIFIAELKNSIVFSLYSTAMLLDNPNNKFYWIYTIKEQNNVTGLKKLTIINPTQHIISAQNIEDIVFD